jgi:hypothetical protein
VQKFSFDEKFQKAFYLVGNSSLSLVFSSYFVEADTEIGVND